MPKKKIDNLISKYNLDSKQKDENLKKLEKDIDILNNKLTEEKNKAKRNENIILNKFKEKMKEMEENVNQNIEEFKNNLLNYIEQ